jgi:hypothetical protein
VKRFLAAIAACVAVTSAQSQSLHLSGTAGYLSEWALDGEVTPRVPGHSGELLGSVIWKHVGLCSVSGPQEKRGDIRMRLSKSGSLVQLDAIFSLDGRQCTFKSRSSSSFTGYLDCSSKGALVPVSLSVK